MSTNLELIDQLRERANVSYEEAKEALEACNNDIIEALIYLEKKNKINPKASAHGDSSFISSVKGLVKKGNETKFVVSKDANTVLNVPVNVAVVTTVLAAPVAIVGAAAALLTNHNIKIQKPDGNDMDINKVFDKMTTAVNTAASKIVDSVKKEDDNNK